MAESNVRGYYKVVNYWCLIPLFHIHEKLQHGFWTLVLGHCKSNSSHSLRPQQKLFLSAHASECTVFSSSRPISALQVNVFLPGLHTNPPAARTTDSRARAGARKGWSTRDTGERQGPAFQKVKVRSKWLFSERFRHRFLLLTSSQSGFWQAAANSCWSFSLAS